MRAGQLYHVVTVERAALAVDDYGAPTTTWTTIATMRAELIDAPSTEEVVRESGASTEAALHLRTRYFAGLTVADRLRFEGTAFDVKELKVIGRRRGLEIRAERVGP
jgi:head-tail adaptor